MAQVVKLKRTAVAGKVPSTSHLELGELAINTYDGRIFFEKDNGTPSIQQVLTTNSQTTGSLDIFGDISASNLYVKGNTTIDGNLTLGGNITIGDSSTDTVSIGADLGSSIIPDSGSTFDLGSSTKKWNDLYVVTANADYFVGDGSGLTNLPAADVSQVATVTSSFDNSSFISVSHNFNTRNIIVSVYDSVYSQLIPQSVVLTDTNTVNVSLSGNHSGFVVVAKGGHIVSGSANDANKLNGELGSYYLDYTNFTNIPSGIISSSAQIDDLFNIDGVISGSDQITNLTTYKEDVSGNSTYSITHNLNEEYPIVQAWNTTTKRQEVPQIVESTSINAISITFSGTFSGRIIVKK